MACEQRLRNSSGGWGDGLLSLGSGSQKSMYEIRSFHQEIKELERQVLQACTMFHLGFDPNFSRFEGSNCLQGDSFFIEGLFQCVHVWLHASRVFLMVRALLVQTKIKSQAQKSIQLTGQGAPKHECHGPAHGPAGQQTQDPPGQKSCPESDDLLPLKNVGVLNSIALMFVSQYQG
eukprot:1156675-Pelagomonas_calceolata.AAC.4